MEITDRSISCDSTIYGSPLVDHNDTVIAMAVPAGSQQTNQTRPTAASMTTAHSSTNRLNLIQQLSHYALPTLCYGVALGSLLTIVFDSVTYQAEHQDLKQYCSQFNAADGRKSCDNAALRQARHYTTLVCAALSLLLVGTTVYSSRQRWCQSMQHPITALSPNQSNTHINESAVSTGSQTQ